MTTKKTPIYLRGFYWIFKRWIRAYSLDFASNAFIYDAQKLPINTPKQLTEFYDTDYTQEIIKKNLVNAS